MLLILWVVLSLTGLAAFVLGHLLGFHGVAGLGAIVVMLTGAGVVADGGLQVKAGEDITRTYTTVGNQVVENQTIVNNSYDNYSWTEQFASTNAIGIGIIQMLLGVLLLYGHFDEVQA